MHSEFQISIFANAPIFKKTISLYFQNNKYNNNNNMTFENEYKDIFVKFLL
jgi:hypothetical protein